ncbi:MAG: aminotransferase class I/II-fold pyridoxal phosphate-dependent enzyme [Actinomycetota bacterium]
MPAARARPWMSAASIAREQAVLDSLVGAESDSVADRVERLVVAGRATHETRCINLNPATNVMNPRAEALLSSGVGTRPSLGHPGAKYETGLHELEEVEVVAAGLAQRVFRATFVEVRVASGSIANLYAFLATCRPGDRVIVPPPSIGGHVTHHRAGAAGLLGLEIHAAPVDAARFSVDVDGLAEQARRVRPALITIGGSLNLLPHPVDDVRRIADEVGAAVLFDAAHLAGPIAGGAWPDPLAQGADLMTMSTYKSLGGPPSGLVVTDRADLAERLDAIAHPGLTANFDVAKTAALAVSLLDWGLGGREHARAMVATAARLADELLALGLPVVTTVRGPTESHQLALDATGWGGGQAAAARLEVAGLLASGIGLPDRESPDGLPGLRLGTNELVRWGMGPDEMPELADLLRRALSDPGAAAPGVAALRARFRTLHHVHV